MASKIEVLEILEATTGGTRRHLLDLVTHLNRDRFSISVICSTLRDKAFLADLDAMKAHGIKVTVVQMARRISPVKDLLAFIRIYRHIKRGNYSVAHTHSSKAGFLGRLAARLAKTLFVVHTPHVFPFQMDVSRIKKALYFRLERLAACFTDKIICVCQNEKDVAVQLGLAPAEKFVVIENGINTATSPTPALREELGLNSKDLVVGTIGRFTLQKGHQYLILAAEHVVKRLPDAKFLLIGNGELRRETEKLIDSLSLRKNCFILSPNDIASFYSIFDIFVLPSLWEGLPYVLLDAMATGKAIIATRTGGVSDAIVQAGMLVPPKDVGSLAQAITDLLENPELRAKLGAKAKDVVKKRYRLSDMIGRIEALYESSLDVKG